MDGDTLTLTPKKGLMPWRDESFETVKLPAVPLSVEGGSKPVPRTKVVSSSRVRPGSFFPESARDHSLSKYDTRESLKDAIVPPLLFFGVFPPTDPGLMSLPDFPAPHNCEPQKPRPEKKSRRKLGGG